MPPRPALPALLSRHRSEGFLRWLSIIGTFSSQIGSAILECGSVGTRSKNPDHHNRRRRANKVPQRTRQIKP